MIWDTHVGGVKLEGGPQIVSTVQRIFQVDVSAMAHVGLMPQCHAALSGYRVLGRDAAGPRVVLGWCSRAAGRRSVIHRSRGDSPSTHGAFPRASPFPRSTFALGQVRAGGCSRMERGDDALTWEKKAKFVRRFAQVGHKVGRGVKNHFGVVCDGGFPNAEVESYGDGGEWKIFLERMGDNLKRWHSTADLDGVQESRNPGSGVVSSEERRHQKQ